MKVAHHQAQELGGKDLGVAAPQRAFSLPVVNVAAQSPNGGLGSAGEKRGSELREARSFGDHCPEDRTTMGIGHHGYKLRADQGQAFGRIEPGEIKREQSADLVAANSLYHCREQSLFPAVVTVERGLGTSHALQDVIQTDRIVAAFEEQLGGDVEDIGLFLLRSCVRDQATGP